MPIYFWPKHHLYTYTIFTHTTWICKFPSVLWRCWLGSRKGIWPVKNWVVGCWCSYLSGARCRLAYGPADATATHCLLLQWNPDGFTFLVPAHPGSPGQRAIKRVCVCLLYNRHHTAGVKCSWTMPIASWSFSSLYCTNLMMTSNCTLSYKEDYLW